jgi:hypothetical protein
MAKLNELMKMPDKEQMIESLDVESDGTLHSVYSYRAEIVPQFL